MRAVLINPNFQRRIRRIAQTTVGPPLGLAYLASMLRQHGHEVAIVDANAMALSLESAVETSLKFAPEVVGITATTPTVHLAADLCRVVKQKAPDVLTVVGGPHVTFMPERTLMEFPHIDVVALGEAEHSFAEFLTVLEREGFEEAAKVKGFAVRLGRTVQNTGLAEVPENLDSLPFPARDLLPMKYYRSTDSDTFTTIIAMRGCPCSCIYCAVPTFYGKRIRFRNPSNVVSEMREVNSKYEVDFFSFVDDTFTCNASWVFDFCEEMIASGLPKKVRWVCLTRPDMVSFDLLRSMRKAGCVRVEYGIETASEASRSFLRKGLTEQCIVEAFSDARRAGLSTMAFVIINIPFETEEDLRKTEELVLKVDPDYLQVSFLTPFPGTALWDIAESNAWIKTYDWRNYSFLNDAVLEHDSVPRQTLLRWHKKMLRDFYLRPKTVLKLLRLVFSGTARVKPMMRTMLAGLLDLFWKKYTREAGS